MENSLFATYLRQNFHFSPNCQSMLFGRVYAIQFLKGANVLFPNEVCKHLYFLESGFMRQYQLINGEEQTVDFAVENQFCTVLPSFLKQQPSAIGIVAEANCMAYKLSYHDWMALEDHSMDFLLLSRCLLAEQLLLADAQRLLFRTATTAQKYAYFCQHYRTANQLARHKEIASYLGITSPSFSRFLKELLTKR